MAIGKKKAMVSVVSHHRCFSGSSLSNLYAAFKCKQLHLGDVVIPESIQKHSLPRNDHRRDHHEERSIVEEKSASAPKDEDDHDGGVRRRMRALAEMQSMVRALQSRDVDRATAAAAAVRAAARKDSGARSTLALMGAIPPLVAMLDASSGATANAALLALLNLAVRNDQNKAAIVQSGAIPKIIRLAEGSRTTTHGAAAAALLSLSALDSNKPAIGAAAGAIEALVRIGDSNSPSLHARRDALGALYNLSIHPGNAAPLVAGGTVAALLAGVYEPELSWRAVAAAANLAATTRGRRALACSMSSALVFLDVLAACVDVGGGGVAEQKQERAAYVVAAMAECSRAQRRVMARGGAVSVLLETVLVGSPAAQEWASRALQCLREDAGGEWASCEEMLLLEEEAPDEQRYFLEMELESDERRAVNRLVQQSLKMNMDKIVQRACIPYLSSNNSAGPMIVHQEHQQQH